MKEIMFLVDKITRSIEDAGSRRSLETDVQRVGLYVDRELYKLIIIGDSKIQGLISLQRAERHIEMHLIETAPHNLGRTKRYVGVVGNLVAFACKISYEAGFDGFVGFTAKTSLIQHYKDSLGAELIFKNRMAISGKHAEKLVNSYFKNYFSGR